MRSWGVEQERREFSDAWSVNTLSSGLVYLDVRELQEPVLLLGPVVPGTPPANAGKK
jgi:hypothetical protein